MKIYFTASTAEFNRYRDDYFAIRNFLIKNNHLLTRDWLPQAEELIKTGRTEVRDIKEIYKACINAIKDAELVVIEDTVSNFSTGHQISTALSFRKPTLVLWQHEKSRQFKQMFIHGIESDRLQVSEYTKDDLETILQAFVQKYEGVNDTSRFHLVLNSVERAYLDWVQFTRHKSRTKVIRESLRNEMDKDEEYEKYLSQHNT